MIPKNRTATRPGEILDEEFLKPLGISQTKLAQHLGVHPKEINQIVRGHKGISSRMAWKLSQALGTSPELWTNLQAMYDLSRNRPEKEIELLSAV